MSEQSFSLIPFPAPHLPAINITGVVSFQSPVLGLQYAVTGDIEEILLPPISLNPSRRDELWRTTCFEFFLAFKEQPDYWEFNMSPSGDWNVYHMDAYRRLGFREEATIAQLPFEFNMGTNGHSLDLAVDLTSMLRPRTAIQMAITAILQTKDGSETYWALAHPAPYADFHIREGFILSPAGQAHPAEPSARAG